MTDQQDTEITKQLRAGLRNISIATVFLYLVMAACIAFVWYDSQNRRHDIERVNRSATTALCALRKDVEARVITSQAYLVKNPKAAASLRTIIQENINNQQRTILALGGLDCPLS